MPRRILLAVNSPKEPLDQIEPRAAGRDEVQVKTRMAPEPRLGLRVLVRRVVIEDEVQLQLRGSLSWRDIPTISPTSPFSRPSAAKRIIRARRTNRAGRLRPRDQLIFMLISLLSCCATREARPGPIP